MNREAIYGGFWNGLREACGLQFTTASRRLKHWADVSAGEQPALFQTSLNESAHSNVGQRGKWELRLQLYIYAKWDVGAEEYALNPLLDTVTNYVNARHPVTGRHPLASTIAGLETIRIEGVIETDEGVLGDQQIAIVPVIITVTD